MTQPLANLPDSTIYEREHALRKISDHLKTPEQYKEAMSLKAEIRRRYALTLSTTQPLPPTE